MKRTYKVHKNYIVDPRGCKIYNDIKRHPLLLLDDKKGQIYNVQSVGLSANGTPFVTLKMNLDIGCARLPKDMMPWVKCMLKMQSNNHVRLFPHYVKFGTTNGGEHYAQFVESF